MVMIRQDLHPLADTTLHGGGYRHAPFLFGEYFPGAFEGVHDHCPRLSGPSHPQQAVGIGTDVKRQRRWPYDKATSQLGLVLGGNSTVTGPG